MSTKNTNCLSESSQVPDSDLWICPKCGSPPIPNLFIKDGGSRICQNTVCKTKFHWCPLKGQETDASPIHPGIFKEEYYNCMLSECAERPQKENWKCPTCQSPAFLGLMAFDGGSVSCSNDNCYTRFHWCSRHLKEIAGTPLHSDMIRLE